MSVVSSEGPGPRSPRERVELQVGTGPVFGVGLKVFALKVRRHSDHCYCFWSKPKCTWTTDPSRPHSRDWVVASRGPWTAGGRDGPRKGQRTRRDSSPGTRPTPRRPCPPRRAEGSGEGPFPGGRSSLALVDTPRVVARRVSEGSWLSGGATSLSSRSQPVFVQTLTGPGGRNWRSRDNGTDDYGSNKNNDQNKSKRSFCHIGANKKILD